jgi:hypothetical protein
MSYRLQVAEDDEEATEEDESTDNEEQPTVDPDDTEGTPAG